MNTHILISASNSMPQSQNFHHLPELVVNSESANLFYTFSVGKHLSTKSWHYLMDFFLSCAAIFHGFGHTQKAPGAMYMVLVGLFSCLSVSGFEGCTRKTLVLLTLKKKK